MNHWALAVGYGVDSGVEYFKVKNSFGATWGMQVRPACRVQGYHGTTHAQCVCVSVYE